MVEKKYADSAAQFEELVRRDGNHVLALNNLAWLCQQTKDTRALEFAERAYRLAGDNPAVLDTLGWLLMEGAPQRALTLLKRANALAPASLEIRYHYGVALLKAGHRPEARALLEPLLLAGNFGHQEEVKSLLAQR
jgi:predicted Zn-dependent protease